MRDLEVQQSSASIGQTARVRHGILVLVENVCICQVIPTTVKSL